jgi:nicotinate-nucleotide adenylyltransferase
LPGPSRLGLLGGTFDPPHVGHAAAAVAVVETLRLDQLLLVVANDPWQKSPTRPITPADDRFAMTEALAGSLERVTASRMEIDRGGPSYTIDTVEALQSMASEIVLVVGADLVPELGSWKRFDELRSLVTLAVVSRPNAGRPPEPDGWKVTWVDGPQVDVSSSEVRAALVAGDPIENLVPEAVIRCIRLRNLYAVA